MRLHYNPPTRLKELVEKLENLEYEIARVREQLETDLPKLEELIRQTNGIETHECEYDKWHIEELLRGDDGTREEEHAKILELHGEPQPVCPWCKNTVGIVYRSNQQYLLRCPCRVIYVRANSPVAAAMKLRLETGE